jgi:hypothetical protein
VANTEIRRQSAEACSISVASPAIALATNSSARAFNVATSTMLMAENYTIVAETQNPIGFRGNGNALSFLVGFGRWRLDYRVPFR